MARTHFPYRFIQGLPKESQRQIWRDLEAIVQAGSIEGHTFVVAASNSNDPKRADYQCSGTNDQDVINEAIAALPSAGGRIILLEGTFTLSGAVVYANASGNFVLQGQGRATIVGGSGQFTRIQIGAHNTAQLRDFAVTIDTGTPSATGINITTAPTTPGSNLIHNISIAGSGDNGSAGIIIGVEGVTQATEIVGVVSNCLLRVVGSAGESPTPGLAVYGQPWSVVDNYVRGFRTGITLNDMTGVIVAGNHVHSTASGATSRNTLILRDVHDSVVVSNHLKTESPGIVLAVLVTSSGNVFAGNRMHTGGTPTVAPVVVSIDADTSNNLFVATMVSGGDAGDTTGINPPAGTNNVAHHTLSTVPGDVINGNHTAAPTGAAGGDLAGTYPSPTVDGLQGRAVVSTAPTDLQYLGWNNGASQWEPKTLPAAVGAQDVKDFTHDFLLMGG